MKLFSTLPVTILFACVSLCVQAQSESSSTPAAEDKSYPIEINKTDANNRRQGAWYIKTDAYMGEPTTISTGSYIDGRKYGTWYNFDSEWRPISILKYYKGVLNGESQYFENGKLVCVGNWRGLNPDETHDTIWVYDPSDDLDYEVVVPTERGTLKHGIWKYYNGETGQLTKMEEYQVGERIKFKEFKPQLDISEEKRKKLEAQLPHNQKNRKTQPLKVKGSLTR